MYEQFIDRAFRGESPQLIALVDALISRYQAEGFRLTVRQVYYQLVSRDVIPNTARAYKNLVKLLTQARLAGLIDWDGIEDRTREIVVRHTWDSPSEFLRDAARSYHVDLWQDQAERPEVWVEKDALAGVFEPICHEWDVPLLSCRGYSSISALYEAAQRAGQRAKAGQSTLVLHFGDHDPSGLDMTRDIEARLFQLNRGRAVRVERIALNPDQIEHYGPPPNPAKTTDSRYEDYRHQHGDESWELDALEPRVLQRLAAESIESTVTDASMLEERRREEHEVQGRLAELRV